MRGNRNIEQLKQESSAFKDAVLSAVPTTLFVLVPIFALMLKLAYLFKRRLYMEHLVVALHSHAFLCLDLLLVLLVRALEQWLAPNGGAPAGPFGWVEGLLLAWMPVYLLIMAERVYAQGLAGDAAGNTACWASAARSCSASRSSRAWRSAWRR